MIKIQTIRDIVQNFFWFNDAFIEIDDVVFYTSYAFKRRDYV